MRADAHGSDWESRIIYHPNSFFIERLALRESRLMYRARCKVPSDWEMSLTVGFLLLATLGTLAYIFVSLIC
jgi:hypothetical protein